MLGRPRRSFPWLDRFPTVDPRNPGHHEGGDQPPGTLDHLPDHLGVVCSFTVLRGIDVGTACNSTG
jgi:hypothetical protein